MSDNQRPAIVIYDEPDIAAKYYRVLQLSVSDEYVLLPLSSVSNLFTQIARRPVPLVLMGEVVQLDDAVSGAQLVRAIRMISPTTYIILNPLHDSAELRAGAQSAGVDVYIPKPFPWDTLGAHIQQGLRQATLERARVADALLTTAARRARALYHIVKLHYDQAGAPYGENSDGLTRWVNEQLDRAAP